MPGSCCRSRPSPRSPRTAPRGGFRSPASMGSRWAATPTSRSSTSVRPGRSRQASFSTAIRSAPTSGRRCGAVSCAPSCAAGSSTRTAGSPASPPGASSVEQDCRVRPARAHVVVVGGGVIGAAALHYLAELGCPSAVLLERDVLGAGSTGHCAGGVRTLFSDELNVRICLESIRRLQRFEDEVGEQLDLRLDGYLFLLDNPADVERFAADLVHQAAAGIDSRAITPEE